MTKLKRVCTVIVVICMLLALLPAAVSADGETSGTCGKNLTWQYDGITKTLTISGTGEMYSYNMTAGSGVTARMLAPWRENETIKNTLEKVVVEDGVTSISSYSFYGCPMLKEVVLP